MILILHISACAIVSLTPELVLLHILPSLASEMLDFVIFAFTAVVGLIVILLFCYFSGSNSKAKVQYISM